MVRRGSTCSKPFGLVKEVSPHWYQHASTPRKNYGTDYFGLTLFVIILSCFADFLFRRLPKTDSSSLLFQFFPVLLSLFLDLDMGLIFISYRWLRHFSRHSA
jgi:hypothetical protein